MVDPYLIAWIASIPGIGPKRFSILQKYFQDLSVFLTASKSDLIVQGIPVLLAESICAHQIKHTPEEIKLFCEQNQVQIISHGSKQYPTLLSQISDSPIVLYLKGQMPDFSRPSIAVVGTRRMTNYGHSVTKNLTGQLVLQGFTIVSGFMYGVDAVAHQTAIALKGLTIGVLGYGLGTPFYPKEHKLLADQMLASGNCLLTEFPPWQTAVAGNFPSRNRIVSGLSLGVLVTEAASKSGSKITAQCAVDQGREVFAIPGPISSTFSDGTKELVNMGAKLVTEVSDVIEELQNKIPPSKIQISRQKDAESEVGFDVG